MAEASTEGQEGKKKIDLGKILLLAFVVMNLGVLGGGVFLVYAGTLGHEPRKVMEAEAYEELTKARESGEQAESVLYTMDQFVVNLSGTPQRVIRVHLSLEMLDADGFEEVVRLGPEARDAVVRILNGKNYHDVETIQGKLFLKDQIAIALNQFLKAGVVKDVYFNDFVVQ